MRSMQATVGIVGASGYSGIEATRILGLHPRAQVEVALSDRWAGDSVERRIGPAGSAGKLRYQPLEEAEARCKGLDAVLLCTPHEASASLAPRLLAVGARVIDLSGAFRLRDAALYPPHYKLQHPAPALLGDAVYGLPELFGRDLPGARLVANPGCYPTAAALALAPLLEAGLLAPEGLVIDAASGTTGAGRKATEDQSFAEVDGDFRAYRVLGHQHAPEIAQTLGRAAGRSVPLTFTAHLLPARRGILATCYGRLAPGHDPAELHQALLHKYAESAFIRLAASPDEVSLKQVVGTNRCLIGVACSAGGLDPGRVVVIAAIDNLVKGAAGQAVQNLNLSCGWPETAGLDCLRGFHP
jgi:N-acetyl-gamma-glutamyl-phosphate reductase